MLYRTPVSGFVYSHDAVLRIAKHPNVIGVKNGTLSWTDSIALRRRAGDRLVISEPNERYWAHDAALFGGRVLYGELSLLLYGKWRSDLHRYTDLALAGDLEKALPLSEKLDPIRCPSSRRCRRRWQGWWRAGGGLLAQLHRPHGVDVRCGCRERSAGVPSLRICFACHEKGPNGISG